MDASYTVQIKARPKHPPVQDAGTPASVVASPPQTPRISQRDTSSTRSLDTHANIGTSSIAIATTDQEIHLLQLNTEGVPAAYGTCPLRPGVVENGVLVQPDMFAKELTMLLATIFPNRKQNYSLLANVCIPESQGYVHHFTTTKSVDAITKNDVLDELSKHVPLEIDEIMFDYTVTLQGGHTQVLCVAVPRQIVQTYRTVFNSLGIEPVSIDVEIAALGRALLGVGDTGSQIIVDIGIQSTSLALFRDRELIASEYVPVGRSTILNTVAEDMPGESMLDIEQESMTVGFLRGTESSLYPALALAFSPILTTIKELQNQCVGFGGGTVEGMYLAGDSALLPGLASFLGTKSGIACSVGDPLRNFSEHSYIEGVAPIVYATVLGLALRSTSTQNTSINLLRSQDAQKTRKNNIRRVLLYTFGVGVVLVLASTLFYFLMR